jgi:hypothetical protein
MDGRGSNSVEDWFFTFTSAPTKALCLAVKRSERDADHLPAVPICRMLGASLPRRGMDFKARIDFNFLHSISKSFFESRPKLVYMTEFFVIFLDTFK